MIQPAEIKTIASKTGVRDTQIEKDYIISWILRGISENAFLRENLIFKGGTVLKKAYFAEYRFSEDLDFTFSGNDFSIESLKSAFKELITWVHDESRISLSIANETLHDTGNYNFYIAYTGPLGGGGAGKDIKVDICKDELLCHSPEERIILNSYSDLTDVEYQVLCYSIEEIAAEKMRSLMQRTAPRDVYDLWYLFEQCGHNIEDCIFSFQDKTKFKNLDPKNFTQVVFGKEKIFSKHWENHLSHQMTSLPEFKEVWRELNKQWRSFQKFMEK